MGMTITDLTPSERKGDRRSEKKRLRQLGQSYKNFKEEVVAEQAFTYITCKCTNQCGTAVTREERETLFERFWKLGSWNAQSTFLTLCIKEVSRISAYIFFSFFTCVLLFIMEN